MGYYVIRSEGFVSLDLWKYIQSQNQQQLSIHQSPRYKNAEVNEQKCSLGVSFLALLGCGMSFNGAYLKEVMLQRFCCY